MGEEENEEETMGGGVSVCVFAFAVMLLSLTSVAISLNQENISSNANLPKRHLSFEERLEERRKEWSSKAGALPRPAEPSAKPTLQRVSSSSSVNFERAVDSLKKNLTEDRTTPVRTCLRLTSHPVVFVHFLIYPAPPLCRTPRARCTGC
jgi:hypothetical protein